jgi:ubiquinone/menaquinone biosynthesis C-methylase UbiE
LKARLNAASEHSLLAAARRYADVVSTDYVGALLERGRERAEAERLLVAFEVADAEALPFAEASFDVVLSTFGVMFTPNQQQAAREMMRVCRPGGKIGLANWTPQGFVGRLFKIIGKYVPWRQALSRRCYGATERISRSCSARRERSLPRPEPT